MESIRLFFIRIAHFIRPVFRRSNIVSVLLLVVFVFSLTYHAFANPPGSPYTSSQAILTPNCGPTDPNCYVSLFPDQNGNNGKVLTTDGTTVSWGNVAGGLSSVSTDSSLTGDGTSGNPLSVVGTISSDVSVLAVKVATAAVLPGSPTYSNGSSGVGATLTRSTNGTIGTIDGISSFSAGDRILVKNQASQLENGIYQITQLGDGGSPYILTRTTDADETSEFSDMEVVPASGTAGAGVNYAQQTVDPTVGSSSIVFVITESGKYVTQQKSGTQASGQIPFWVTKNRQLSKGNSNLFWDNSTGRLGVGDNTPAALLTVGAGDKFQIDTGGAALLGSSLTQVFGTVSEVGSLSATLTTTSGIVVVNNYAYASSYATASVAIIDVTNPASPALAGTYSTLNSVDAINVVGNYLYALTDSGFEVADVSNPSAATRVGSMSLPTPSSATFRFLQVQGKYAYVSNNSGGGYVAIIDITNPASPNLVGSTTSGSVLGATVVGKYIYAFYGSDNSFRIFDATNPTSPSLVSTTASANAVNRGVTIVVVGRYAYVSCRSFGLRIYDLSNIAAPTLAYTGASISGGGLLQVVGKYMYVPSFLSTANQIYDVSNPVSPQLVVSSFGSSTIPLAFVRGRYIYADNDTTFKVYDMNTTSLPSAAIGSLSTGGLFVSGRSIIDGSLFAGSLNTGFGGIHTDGILGTGGVTTPTVGAPLVSGTNIAGSNLTLSGGNATGNATGGSILFQTSDAGSSGSTLQSLSTKMSILASGKVGIGITPTATLHVKGSGATSASSSLFIVNSDGSKSFQIRDDGAILRNGDVYSVPHDAVLIDTTWGPGAGASLTTGDANVLLGYIAGQAITSGGGNVAVGVDSGMGITTGNQNVSIGTDAQTSLTTGSNNIAIGQTSGLIGSASGSDSIAIGAGAGAFANSIAIGSGAQTTASNQLVIGHTDPDYISDVYFGDGVQSSGGFVPHDVTIHASGGLGTNVVGGGLTLATGLSTGSGVGGNILFKLSYPSSSGNSVNSLSTVGTFLASNKASSGTQNLISLTPTVNQSGTAGYTGLLLNVTQTATGSGTKRLFDVQADGVTKFNVANTGDVTIVGSGTTCTIGNGVGATNCTSDSRLKQNVTPLTGNLVKVLELQPITFQWNALSGHDQTVTHQGFIAQDVQTIFPDSVHTVYDDYLGIDYASLVVPLAGAIQELDLKVEPLTSLDLNTTGSLANLVKQFLADAGNTISDLFANRIHTKTLCIADDGGNETCLSKSDIDTIMSHSGGSNSGGGSSGSSNPPPSDTTAPTITLLGESTITLSVGDSFTDPGATATDDTDGDITTTITTTGTVDTQTPGTYTITYSATDQAGNTGTNTRTIIVNPVGGGGDQGGGE